MLKSLLAKQIEKRKNLSKSNRQAETTLYIMGLIAMCLILLLVIWSHVIGKPISFPRCAFNKVTGGYYCPGCGGTRAVLALLQGQLLKSILYHPLIAYTLVFGGWFMLSQTIERLSCRHVLIGMPIRHGYFYIALGLAVFHALFLDFFLLTKNIDFLSQF